MLGVRACVPVLEATLYMCDTDNSLEYIVVLNQVQALVIVCRDLLVVRAQFLYPVGEKALFEAVIEAAYGESIAKDSHVYSSVMNAYHKTLADLPNKFLSKNSCNPRKSKRIRAPNEPKECGASSSAAE